MNSLGHLSAAETFAFIRDAAIGRVKLLRASAIDPRTVAEVSLPAGALPDWALTTCRSMSDEWLVNHCVRTYLWGAALAKRDGASFDVEHAFAASMFHDIALTSTHLAPAGCCFAVHGATIAEQLLKTRGLGAEHSASIADAIRRHLDVTVPLSLGEARVVHEGAALDVIGSRFGELSQASCDEVIARYPRSGFKTKITQALKAHTDPHTRARWLFRFGFENLIKRAPFAS